MNTVGYHVSRETHERLEILETTLRKWNQKINLIAPSDLPNIRERHFDDSAQLDRFAPTDVDWADLGSGGGFPGLVIAALRAEESNFYMTLIESDIRKAAFLEEAARLMALNITIENRRIEAPPIRKYDVVSARALAPTPHLLQLAAPYLEPSGKALFLKGIKAERELKMARKNWRFESRLHVSSTAPQARIVEIWNLAHA